MMNTGTYQGRISLMVSGPSTDLVLAPVKVRLKKGAMVILGAIVLGGIMVAIGKGLGWNWLVWTGAIIGGLLCVAGVFMGLKTQVALCPYCGSTVGLDMDNDLATDDENKPVECLKCHEWLLSNAGKLGPMDEAQFENLNGQARPPLFEDGRWPDECLTCGAATTRYDAMSKFSLDGWALLVGSISTRTAKVGDVPYCNLHADQVTLHFNDDKPVFRFKELGPMRRYVSVNFGKKPIVVKKK
jgi:hypothetical protein